MKKRNTAIRALSVFLAYAMLCTSVPAAGQEMFVSGVNRETEENTSDLRISEIEQITHIITKPLEKDNNYRD